MLALCFVFLGLECRRFYPLLLLFIYSFKKGGGYIGYKKKPYL